MDRISGYDFIWIATALMAYEVHSREPEAGAESYYFTQEEIVERVNLLTPQGVRVTDVSHTCCADMEGSVYRYLTAGTGEDIAKRRLSAVGEYLEKVLPVGLDDHDTTPRYHSSAGAVSFSELFTFVRGVYSNVVGSSKICWVIPGNPTKFDAVSAFRELGTLQWKQTTNVREGDIVYLYLSNPVQEIRFRCRAKRVNLDRWTIDDRKFDHSGEYDGSFGRYMELERIEEYEGELYSLKNLQEHGFSAPQGAVRMPNATREYLRLINELRHSEEMDPNVHDASYELVREVIRSYEGMGDLFSLDFRDLNLVYLSTIGTWKHGVKAKKKSIRESHLSDVEKNRLDILLDRIEDRVRRREYENRNAGDDTFGMFGTGFHSFEKKTDPMSAREFIQMCIDIDRMTDEEKIFDRVAELLNDGYPGMRAASASMVLHCLKPDVFPIFNNNMGNPNIYSYLGVELVREKEVETYVENCRRVRAFRDRNFTVKNYRIFDMAAWELENKMEKMEEFSGRKTIDGFYPILEEYDPGITKERYLELFADKERYKPENMYTLYYLLQMDGAATCKQLAQRYGGKPGRYLGNGNALCKNVAKDTECPLYKDRDGANIFWSVLFYGKILRNNEDGTFVWKLREPLREALIEMEQQGYFKGLFGEEFADEESLVSEEQSYFDRNLILYGPPGTGKTYHTVYYAVAICDGKSLEDTKRMDFETVKKRYDALAEEGRIVSTTFHQSYGYEEFIEGIRPIVREQGIGYQYEDGVFKSFCRRAESEKDAYVFIIDEINRGNLSKIFGELITLVEDTKRKGMAEELSVVLPYSGERFSVPNNLFLLGTMNTADRSIALMDTALRRRFRFVEMMPDPDVLDGIQVQGVDVSRMLGTINRRIEYLFDREHTIGHAFFTKLRENPSLELLGAIFRKNVLPLLQEYFYEDYAKIQLVLGDNAKEPGHRFILEERVDLKSLFRGKPDMDIEAEFQYRIQEEAFYKIESYQGIGEA